MAQVTIWCRVKPTNPRPTDFVCGMLFTQEWKVLTEVDPATVRRLRAEDSLEVSTVEPVGGVVLPVAEQTFDMAAKIRVDSASGKAVGIFVDGRDVVADLGVHLEGKDIGSKIPAAGIFTSFRTTGNVGIGTQPKGWGSLTALEVKGTVAMSGFSNGAEGGFLSSNAFFDGAAWNYMISGGASYIRQTGGVTNIFSAPSGAANAPITFTQVLAAEKDRSIALQGAATQPGSGITFPSAQFSSSNPNTFDDYEEGVWTASIGGATTPGTYEISSQNCTYTKTGRKVFIEGNVVMLGGLTGGGAGNMLISGLPFAKSNGNPVGAISVAMVSLDANCKTLILRPTSNGAGGTQLILYQLISGAAGVVLPINAISGGAIFAFSISYEV